jgi:hypothetical protein
MEWPSTTRGQPHMGQVDQIPIKYLTNEYFYTFLYLNASIGALGAFYCCKIVFVTSKAFEDPKNHGDSIYRCNQRLRDSGFQAQGLFSSGWNFWASWLG